MTTQPRAITITTCKRAWRTCLILTHLDHPPSASPGTPDHDTDRAFELLTRTATMPPSTASESSSPNGRAMYEWIWGLQGRRAQRMGILVT